MNKQTEVLAYIYAHPGTTSSGINKAVRNGTSLADWVYTRQEIDRLVADGRVEKREYRGIDVFYPKAGHADTAV